MISNRRKHIRHELNLPVRIATRPFEEHPPFLDAIISNISSSGTFISTEQDLPIASKIFLEFELHFDELAKLHFVLSLESLKRFSGQVVKIQATGIVIRIQKGGAGIIFDQDYQLFPI